MKKFYTLLLLAGLAAAGCSKDELGADRVVTDDFDPLFAQELQTRGYVDDAAYITPAKVENIETLDVSGNSGNYGVLTSLRGIEYFTALKSLDCSSNQLTELDVTKNTALTELQCSNNQLTELDVTKNTELTELQCSNNQLEALDVSRNAALTTLACSANYLRSLNVSFNRLLTDLQCSNNIKSVVGINPNTGQEQTYEYRLQVLILSNSLEHLSCDWGDFGTLDLSNCPALKTVHCSSCHLYNLILPRNTNATLTEVYCTENYLASLDLTYCTKLAKLHCFGNNLQSLDITHNQELEVLYCYGNPGVEGEETGKGVFAVSAWFGNENVPTGTATVPNPMDPSQNDVKNYEFTTGEWKFEYFTLQGEVERTVAVTIDYRKRE